MQRLIISPAVLPPAALADLKAWLAITTTRDDAVLSALLRASLDACEAFTGVMPLMATCEESIPASQTWQPLATRPVQAITSVSAVNSGGTTTPLPAGNYEIDLAGDGAGLVRVTVPGATKRIAVRFSAGLAADWAALPEGLRHGIIRLAAHQHRERETSGAGMAPPASVTALWRPWRRVSLV